MSDMSIFSFHVGLSFMLGKGKTKEETWSYMWGNMKNSKEIYARWSPIIFNHIMFVLRNTLCITNLIDTTYPLARLLEKKLKFNECNN